MSTPDERLSAAIGAAGGRSRGDFESLGAAARAELAKAPTVRAWWVDALLLVGVNAMFVVAAGLSMSWSSTQHVDVASTYAVGAAWLVVMTLGSIWALRPGKAALRWSVMAAFGVVAVLSLVLLSGLDSGRPFMAGLSCALVDCAVTIVPIAVVVALSMRFAAQPSHLVVGALAGSAGGALTLHLHCGNGTVAHVAVFHLLPGLVLAGAAVLVRSRMKSKSFVP